MDAEQLDQEILIYGDPNTRVDYAMERRIDSMALEVLEEYQVRQINRVLEVARKSAFWIKQLEGISLIQTTKDLERIAVTTRLEINKLYEQGKWNQTLTVPEERITHVVTSGHTGLRPPFVSGMTDNEYSYYVADIMRLFFRNGVREGDTLLNVFPGRYVEPEGIVRRIGQLGRGLEEYRSEHVAGTLFRDAGIRYGLNVISTGLPMMALKKSVELAEREALRVNEIYKEGHARVVATSPNMLFNGILPAMKEDNLRLRDLQTEIVILGGQDVTLEMLRYLERSEGVRVVSWMESGEVCTIAYSSNERTSRGDFVGMTPASLFTFFEVVDAYGKQLPLGKRGRLLATRLVTHAQPLIRYDLEDETAFIVHKDQIIFDRAFTKL